MAAAGAQLLDLPTFGGASVTIPLKEAALKSCHELSPAAARIGARARESTRGALLAFTQGRDRDDTMLLCRLRPGARARSTHPPRAARAHSRLRLRPRLRPATPTPARCRRRRQHADPPPGRAHPRRQHGLARHPRLPQPAPARARRRRRARRSHCARRGWDGARSPIRAARDGRVSALRLEPDRVQGRGARERVRRRGAGARARGAVRGGEVLLAAGECASVPPAP